MSILNQSENLFQLGKIAPKASGEFKRIFDPIKTKLDDIKRAIGDLSKSPSFNFSDTTNKLTKDIEGLDKGVTAFGASVSKGNLGTKENTKAINKLADNLKDAATSFSNKKTNESLVKAMKDNTKVLADGNKMQETLRIENIQNKLEAKATKNTQERKKVKVDTKALNIPKGAEIVTDAKGDKVLMKGTKGRPPKIEPSKKDRDDSFREGSTSGGFMGAFGFMSIFENIRDIFGKSSEMEEKFAGPQREIMLRMGKDMNMSLDYLHKIAKDSSETAKRWRGGPLADLGLPGLGYKLSQEERQEGLMAALDLGNRGDDVLRSLSENFAIIKKLMPDVATSSSEYLRDLTYTLSRGKSTDLLDNSLAQMSVMMRKTSQLYGIESSAIMDYMNQHANVIKATSTDQTSMNKNTGKVIKAFTSLENAGIDAAKALEVKDSGWTAISDMDPEEISQTTRNLEAYNRATGENLDIYDYKALQMLEWDKSVEVMIQGRDALIKEIGASTGVFKDGQFDFQSANKYELESFRKKATIVAGVSGAELSELVGTSQKLKTAEGLLPSDVEAFTQTMTDVSKTLQPFTEGVDATTTSFQELDRIMRDNVFVSAPDQMKEAAKNFLYSSELLKGASEKLMDVLGMDLAETIMSGIYTSVSAWFGYRLFKSFGVKSGLEGGKGIFSKFLGGFKGKGKGKASTELVDDVARGVTKGVTKGGAFASSMKGLAKKGGKAALLAGGVYLGYKAFQGIFGGKETKELNTSLGELNDSMNDSSSLVTSNMELKTAIDRLTAVLLGEGGEGRKLPLTSGNISDFSSGGNIGGVGGKELLAGGTVLGGVAGYKALKNKGIGNLAKGGLAKGGKFLGNMRGGFLPSLIGLGATMGISALLGGDASKSANVENAASTGWFAGDLVSGRKGGLSKGLKGGLSKGLKGIPVLGTALGLGMSAYDIYNAKDKKRAVASNAGGWLGGLTAGAGAGALVGTLGGGPVGTAIGAVLGGIAGAVGGEAATTKIYDNMDKIKGWFGFASGLSNVPMDGYPALLHKGEMVLPAKQANWLRVMMGANPVTASGITGTVGSHNKFVNSLPAYASGIDSVGVTGETNIHEGFYDRLVSLAMANGSGIFITSGHRTFDRQRELIQEALTKRGYYGSDERGAFNSKGQMMVAPVGGSRHNYGVAADVSGWAQKLDNGSLNSFGLYKPMSYENWHIEPIETRGKVSKSLADVVLDGKTFSGAKNSTGFSGESSNTYADTLNNNELSKLTTSYKDLPIKVRAKDYYEGLWKQRKINLNTMVSKILTAIELGGIPELSASESKGIVDEVGINVEKAIEGINPSRSDAIRYLKSRASARGIPEQIALATAWTESTMTQFKDGNVLAVGPSGNKDYGLMQLNKRSWENNYDWNKVSSDWQYNVDAGLDILLNRYNVAIGKGLDPARGAYSGYNTWSNLDRYATTNDIRDINFFKNYQNSPWGAYKLGGVVGEPTMSLLGEDAPQFKEYVIPTNPKYRARAVDLISKASEDVGVSAVGDMVNGLTVNVDSNNGEVVNNLKTIAGKLDDLISVMSGTKGGIRRASESVVSPSSTNIKNYI